MPSHRAEVTVLGAGPAGTVAARQLGQAGIDVLLIDAGAAGAGHVVETLPPSGAPLADEIGLLEAICENSDGPAAQVRMLWRDAPETWIFEGDGPLLLRRQVLHDVLKAEALRNSRFLRTRVRNVITTMAGAELMTDAGKVTCQMVVDARGRHATKRVASDLIALPFIAEGGVPGHTMWLEAMSAGWIWACSLNTQEVHGVLFQQADVLSGLSAAMRLDHATRCLAVTNAFAGLADIRVGTPAAAGLSAVDDPIVDDCHVLVGDAALARDPIASHGLVHAMRSGVQSAIAVMTLLDPSGDSHAARSFLRHKHSEAVTTARRATAQAYRDQTRHHGSFWTQNAKGLQTAALRKIGAGPVTLAKPLTRAPVLDSDRIRWAPAIELPASQDFFTSFGSVSALDIATACRPAAPLQDLAMRLGNLHSMPLVFEVLEHLAFGGAFAQTSRLS